MLYLSFQPHWMVDVYFRESTIQAMSFQLEHVSKSFGARLHIEKGFAFLVLGNERDMSVE